MKHPSEISINEFDYVLPEERIALYPLAERDQSKLLIYRAGQNSTKRFTELPEHLPPGCSLVFNNSRVISARLNFKNDNGRDIEIFCLEPADDHKSVETGLLALGQVTWNCLVGNFRRWKQESLSISKNNCRLSARVHARREGYAAIDFSWESASMNFAEILHAVGNIPIPPYLNRQADQTDEQNYQTVYSSKEGSVAAPTAGLHFTPAVMQALQEKKFGQIELTLHVGAGTFQPVKADTMAGHQMHSEWMDVNIQAIRAIAEAGRQKLVAVGTTSLRTLESLYWMGVKSVTNPECDLADLEVRQWDPYELTSDMSMHDSMSGLLKWMEMKNLSRLVCRTGILIAPPYEVKMVCGLITNFHQPKSTLLLLVAAFTGGNWKQIYDYALKNDFRFLSYGDSSLLLNS